LDVYFWRAALLANLGADHRGWADVRAHAAPYSSDACAQQVLDAWTGLLDRRGW
jgi:hypothetical protein